MPRALQSIPIQVYSATVSETDYAEWSGGVTYAVGDRRIRSSQHAIFERLIAGGGTTPPEDDAVNWWRVSSTSRWMMFDDSPSTATAATGTVGVVLSVASAVDGVVLSGVKGTQLQVYGGASGTTLLRTVAVPAPVYPATTSRVVVSGLSVAAGERLGLTVTGSGTVEVGSCLIGRFVDLGETVSIDWELDDFSTVLPSGITYGPYSRKLRAACRCPTSSVGTVAAALESMSGVLTYIEFDPAGEAFNEVGYRGAWEFTLREVNNSSYTLVMQGLSRDDVAYVTGAWEQSTASALGGAESIPVVTGLAVRLVAGGIEFGWNACTAAGYVGTEIRSGGIWSTAAPVFSGAANRWVWLWPANGTYQLRFRHVGTTTDSGADAIADVVVTSSNVNVTFTIPWEAGDGSDVTWDDGSGADALWGISLARDPRVGQNDLQTGAVGTTQLQPGATLDVGHVSQTGPFTSVGQILSFTVNPSVDATLKLTVHIDGRITAATLTPNTSA